MRLGTPKTLQVTLGLWISRQELDPDVSEGINMATVEIPRMGAEELKAKLDRGGAVTVVDVRATSAFEEHHIRGAISMPVMDVDTRFRELPSDRTIVCY